LPASPIFSMATPGPNGRWESPVSVTAPNWPVVALACGAIGFLGILLYTVVKFAPIVSRNFQRPPLFQPLRVGPLAGGEDVRFRADDGIELHGSYFRARGLSRAGLVLFCPEFLGDRWSFQPYAEPLLDAGFDVFAFDFRNHGDSESEPDYDPLPWVSDREVLDLKAAIATVLSRPDADPAGLALFGISRGGSTALRVAADEPRVWAVITDGAFPTRGTLRVYMCRWAEVYIPWKLVARNIPMWVIDLVWWRSRHITQNRLNRHFPDVEQAVERLSPRPWLMIHGAKDNYIVPEIAEELFRHAREPKESWIVPGARHNRCREVAPEEYPRRLLEFLAQYAPRSLAMALPDDQPEPADDREAAASPVA
ncbi:MAG: alpha/beta fold hydrolase, partial [Isosphaeraceae bacterium]